MNIEFSPYTFARVSVMKSTLLKKIHYDRMLKMKISEITKFLEEMGYSKEINEFGIELEGADLIETSISRNLGSTLEKLYNISNDEMKIVMSKYLGRKDIWNVKTIIRGKYSGLEPHEIKKLIVPVGLIKKNNIESLIQLESVEDVLRNIDIIDIKLFKPAIDYYDTTNSLLMIENTLDQFYFADLIEFLKSVPESISLFRDFLLMEIDILNIKNMIKLKRAKQSEKQIKAQLFYCGLKLNKKILDKLLKAKDINGLIGMLADGPYKKIIEPFYKEKINLLDLEVAMDNYLLSKARFMPHVSPLSVNGLLGYMFAKEIEIKNIHMIVRAKQLDIGEKFIVEHLIA